MAYSQQGETLGCEDFNTHNKVLILRDRLIDLVAKVPSFLILIFKRGIFNMKSFYIGKKELARKLNSSPSSVSRWSKDVPDFPKPFLISPNKVVWDLREILRYINKRKEVRGFFGHKPKKDK